MTASAIRFLKGLAPAALAIAAVLSLASCGSGAVSDNTGSTTAPSPIAITPSTATLFSDLPTTFVLSGGNGSYVVTSNNQAVIPLGATRSGSQLIVVPNAVAADTPITLTVSDTANNTATTATVTVKPRTISNVVTVTPSANDCGTAVCAGGDAEVKVSLTQGGTPLVGRTVRFDVLSGDVRIIASSSGGSETLSTTGTTITDSTGTARIRVRVLSDATAQTALLQATDLSTGFVQTASVTVARSANAALTVRPTSILFTGVNSTSCAAGVTADILIVGGSPPYQVTQPAGFSVTPLTVSNSGGRVTVGSTGQCVNTDVPLSVIDSTGASATVTLRNVPGPAAAEPPAFVVAPKTVSLESCSAQAQVTLAGGTGNYYAASGNQAVIVSTNGTFGVIQRSRGTTTDQTSIPVSFSDGRTTQEVNVVIGVVARSC